MWRREREKDTGVRTQAENSDKMHIFDAILIGCQNGQGSCGLMDSALDL